MLAAAQQPQSNVAPTPPMGWNSWDAYGLTITEPQFRANVDVLRDKLLPLGWNYAVVDEGWFFENPGDRPTPDKLHYALDPYGRYVPVPARFPSAVVTGSASPLASPADATHKLPGEGHKRGWPPLIKMDASVRKKIDAIFGNAGDKR